MVSAVSALNNSQGGQVRHQTIPLYTSYATTWSVNAPHLSTAHQAPVIDHQSITSMNNQMASLQAQMDNLRAAHASLGLVPSQNWHHTQPASLGAGHVPNIDFLSGHQQAAAAPPYPAAQPGVLAPQLPARQTYRPVQPSPAPAGIASANGQPVLYQAPSSVGNAFITAFSNNTGGHQPAIHLHRPTQAEVSSPLPTEPSRWDFKVSSLKNIDLIDNVLQYSPVEGISDRSLRNALKGNYANLEEYLPAISCTLDINENETLMESASGILSYKSKRSQNSINDLGTWLQAYLNYQHVMVRVHGLVAYFAMHDYINYIYDSDIKFQWDTVQAFDIRHRQKISGKTINMKAIDPLMVATMLDKVSVKDYAKCTKCKSRHHSTEDCPLSSTQPSGTKRNRNKGKPKDEICKAFNTKACTFQGCKRQHKCYGCRGDLPFQECCKTGPCNGKGNTPAEKFEK